MKVESLKESLEEHEMNLEGIEYLTKESLKHLYTSLVEEVLEALNGELDE